jgi:pimeloyl-ACP methyl ester carboxylesterase
MARFVLVHGAFAGAWIWKPLAERLRAAGHSVEAFDLPGLGDDETHAVDVTLDACAARLCDVLTTGREPAVVVGNSMGGVIATQGAARCPERVAALVYVAAFVPKDGQSLLDLTKLPEGADDQVQANITIEGEPPVAIMPAGASRQALYGSCAEDVASRAIAQQRPQPVAPFATRDRAIPPALQRRMINENPFAGVVELDTDHTPQLSMTNELADALHQFAIRIPEVKGQKLGSKAEAKTRS